jgi:hypothetical protein
MNIHESINSISVRRNRSFIHAPCRFAKPPFTPFKFFTLPYSVLKLFTGLATAAFIDW